MWRMLEGPFRGIVGKANRRIILSKELNATQNVIGKVVNVCEEQNKYSAVANKAVSNGTLASSKADRY